MNMPALEQPSLQVFERYESEVRSYCRSFETVFAKGKNALLWDTQGREYIDFFAGAGALNYGHNNDLIKARLIDYIRQDGVTHSLDMATSAKEHFLKRFQDVILKPRGLDYKVMFPGPTGTNSVESALKIARKVTGRTGIICFTNAFHGMTMGSLAVTGNKFKRKGAGLPLGHAVFMPYDGYLGQDWDTTEYLAKVLDDPGSGIELPAAVILETVQGEGGLHAARPEWLRRVAAICRERGILLIVDDIQMGCGRTGTFFSFEPAGLKPDIVCLSKSIGGYGLPMAVTLLRPDIDIWSPGEHNGTFRGNNLAFVAAAEAFSYWESRQFVPTVMKKAELMEQQLKRLILQYPELGVSHRGRGMIQGIAFDEPSCADALCRLMFRKGVIMETSGPDSEVAKLMPPLTVETKVLEEGLLRLSEAMEELAHTVSMQKRITKKGRNGDDCTVSG